MLYSHDFSGMTLWPSSSGGFSLRLFIIRCCDREPVAVGSCVLWAIGLGLPLVVPAIRSRLGFDTDQYYRIATKPSILSVVQYEAKQVGEKPGMIGGDDE